MNKKLREETLEPTKIEEYEAELKPNENITPKRMVLVSLLLSRFATASPGALLGLLLVDIGLDFNRPVGMMGQIQTVSSIVAVVFALLMGILSAKYDHRKLILLVVQNIAGSMFTMLTPKKNIMVYGTRLPTQGGG